MDKKILLTLSFLLVVGLQSVLFAQENEVVVEETTTEEPVKTGTQFSIGISGSTRGVGIDMGIGISQKFQLRFGGTYFQFDQSFQVDVEGEPFNLDADVDLKSLQLLADYYPFKGSSFKLTGGLAYHLNEDYSINGVYVGDEVFSLGEISIDGDDVGTLGVDVTYEKFAPYAGLGFGRAVPKGRVNFGFEMGTYYNSSPNVTINATKMLSETSSQSDQLEENMQDYRFYPVIMFRLGVKI
ncbi:hypothetical protein [Chondrinema litorale]|uniref:hypothetical protein n=1 Tax=Chondrinema litorale TaxID=2994555 RepID=UPI0025430B3C|nr:hypothetical protein [Chondrinema litorale]UZR94471.1 hypothetical protein OQ292_01390 [Chondrinema litorale]